MARSPGRFMGL